MDKESKETKNDVSSAKVFISVALWGLAILACMYIGSFIVSFFGSLVYYGVLLIVSVFVVRYVEKKLKSKL